MDLKITRQESIEVNIVEPIEAEIDENAYDSYDIEAIADETLGGYAENYAMLADEAEFWEIVEKHAYKTDSEKHAEYIGKAVAHAIVSMAFPGVSIDPEPTSQDTDDELIAAVQASPNFVQVESSSHLAELLGIDPAEVEDFDGGTVQVSVS